MSSGHYRPGDALAFVGPRGAVLAQEPVDVEALWSVVGAPALTAAAVVDVLSVDGLARVPSFCAVSFAEDGISVLVRGDFVVEVGEESLDGRGLTTWSERYFAGHPSTVRLHSGSPEGVVLPLDDGVVRAAEIVYGVTDDVPEPVVTSDPEPEATPEPEPDPEPEPTPEPEPDPEPEPEPETEPEPPADKPVADPNLTLTEPNDSRFDAMFGATVHGRRLEDAAVRPSEVPLPPPAAAPAAGPTGASGGDHDGATIGAAERAALRARRASAQQTTPPPPPAAGPPPPPPPPPVARSVRARLEFSTGRIVELTRPVVVGRSPRAHGATSADLQQIVRIDNPYVSGTHLVVETDDGVVLVTDVSTNGTVLVAPGGVPPRRLDKGRATVVTDGSVLQLSDDITATIRVDEERS